MIKVSGCTTSAGGVTTCPDSSALQLDLEPTIIGVQPPASYYELQPCDEVTWDFGDGSAAITPPAGTAMVAHTWASPGNYEVEATVRNALGSMTFSLGPIVIASDPAKLSWPRLPNVSETAGTLNIPIRRTGDMSRRVTARMVVAPSSAWIEPVLSPSDLPVVFEPGEAEHVIRLPLRDNLIYDGARDMRSQIRLVDGEGGVILENGDVTITDNEPQPRMTCDDVAVNEGDRGRTRVVIPCRLSGPLSFWATLHPWLEGESATRGVDFYEYILFDSPALHIEPGELTGAISLDILGDTQVEPDEQFMVYLQHLAWNWYTGNDRSPRITILNDDAALVAERRSIDVGERIELRLHPGAQYAVPTEIALDSSDPAALAVPPFVTVTPGAHSVTFTAESLAPGASTVTADLGTRSVAAEIMVMQAAAVMVSRPAITLANGASTSLSISLSPASASPVLARLTADPRIIRVPADVLIPPGGAVTIGVHAVGVGGTAIGVTTDVPGVVGSSVLVDVVATGKRRATR